MKLPSSQFRMWFYGVITAALAVLVALKIIDPALVPVWLALAAAVLAIGGTGTATVAVAKQRGDGTLND